ncbi:unnamed protein product [Heterobilharzia americana]|nr:unnamed protein product [Heterobilharzia americana]
MKAISNDKTSSTSQVVITPITLTTAIHPSSPASILPSKIGTLIPNRIFVGGINSNTTEDELRTFFSTYGTIKDVKVINDKSRQSKGTYGFVTFENQETAESIIKSEAESLMFKDRKLNIGYAVRKQNVLPRQEMRNTYFPAHSVCSPTNGLSFLQICPYDHSFITLNQPIIYYPTTPTTVLLPQCRPTVQDVNSFMNVNYNINKPNNSFLVNSNLLNMPVSSHFCTHIIPDTKPQMETELGTTTALVSTITQEMVTVTTTISNSTPKASTYNLTSKTMKPLLWQETFNEQLCKMDSKPLTTSLNPDQLNLTRAIGTKTNEPNNDPLSIFLSPFAYAPPLSLSTTSSSLKSTLSSSTSTKPTSHSSKSTPFITPSAYSVPRLNSLQHQHTSTKYPCLFVKPEDAMKWMEMSQKQALNYPFNETMTENLVNDCAVVNTSQSVTTTTLKTTTPTDKISSHNPVLLDTSKCWDHKLYQFNHSQYIPFHSHQMLSTQMKSFMEQPSQISSNTFKIQTDLTNINHVNDNDNQSGSLLMRLLHYPQNKYRPLINSSGNKNDHDNCGSVYCANNNSSSTEIFTPCNDSCNMKFSNKELQSTQHQILSKNDLIDLDCTKQMLDKNADLKNLLTVSPNSPECSEPEIEMNMSHGVFLLGNNFLNNKNFNGISEKYEMSSQSHLRKVTSAYNYTENEPDCFWEQKSNYLKASFKSENIVSVTSSVNDLNDSSLSGSFERN